MDTNLIQKALQGNIIDTLGLQTLPEEKKFALIESLTKLVMVKIVRRIDEQLSPEDQKAFDQAIDGGSQPQLDTWLKSKNIDLDQIMAEELARVKDDLAKRAEAIDQAV